MESYLKFLKNSYFLGTKRLLVVFFLLNKNENATIFIMKQVGVRYTQKRRDGSEKIEPLNKLQLFVQAENTHTRTYNYIDK